MTTTSDLVRFWAARGLGLAYAAFLGVFALDAFGEGKPLGRASLDFAIHLIPSAVVLAVVAVAWRRPLAGGVGFLAMAAWYVATTWGRMHWSAPVLIAGPALLIGLLFLLEPRPQGPAPGEGRPASVPPSN